MNRLDFSHFWGMTFNQTSPAATSSITSPAMIRPQSSQHIWRAAAPPGRCFKASEKQANANRYSYGKQAEQYDEAVCLLEDLRDLAVMTGSSSDFSQHMSALYGMRQRKPSLVRRFQKAMLLPLEETPGIQDEDRESS